MTVAAIDIIVVFTLCWVARRRGLAEALPYFTFFVVLLPEQSQFKLPGLFDVTTRRLAVVTLLALYLTLRDRKKRFRLPLGYAMLLGVTFAIVSTFVSLHFLTSFKQLLAQVIEYYLVYFIFVRVVSRRETILKIEAAFALAIGLCCVFGIAEAYLQWSVLTIFPQQFYEDYGMSSGPLYIEQLDRGLRIRSTFPHPILFGDAVVMALPVGFDLLSLPKSPLNKRVLWLSIVLMLWSVYKTSSRGPWIAAGVSLALGFLLLNTKAKKQIFAIAAIAGITLIFRPGVQDTIVNMYRATLDSTSAVGSSYEYRYAVWQAVKREASADPVRAVFGYGLGTFRELGVIVDFHDSEGPTSYRWYTCDNSYALLLYELGYGGLIIMATLLARPLWLALRSYSRLAKQDRHLLSALFISVLLFYWLMGSVAAYGWGQPGYILWIQIAMIIALTQVKRKSGRQVLQSPKITVQESNAVAIASA